MTRGHALYSIHPSVAYARTVLNNIPAKTGRTLEEWTRLLESQGPADVKERREWLKREHGLGGTTAAMIVDHATGINAEDIDPAAYLRAAEQCVEAMYAGPKAGLRPLHDALIALARRLGPDVRVCPCKTMVPLFRHHVFAQIKPATRTRIDLGLALKGVPRQPPKRLLDTGGLAKGDRITHRIPLASPEDVDPEVEQWLQVAYDLDRRED
jgi:hypothetical protein